MITKLTLSMDKIVIERAKEFARKSGRSLSDLVESYLESLVESGQDDANPVVPPKLHRLFGIARIPTNLDHKKEIRKIMSSKHRK